jgi:hypothetical protein
MADCPRWFNLFRSAVVVAAGWFDPRPLLLGTAALFSPRSFAVVFATDLFNPRSFAVPSPRRCLTCALCCCCTLAWV